MSDDFKPAIRHFTAFQSAAEETADKEMRDRWINEGGRFLVSSGHIIQIVGGEDACKALLTFEDGETTERHFRTTREAEAFVSRNTPRPPKRDTSRDQPPRPD